MNNGIESYDFVAYNGSFKFNDDSKNIDTPTTTPTPEKNDENIRSEVFKEGAIMSWDNKGALGYRLFRSITESDLGVSVTDFYITSNS